MHIDLIDIPTRKQMLSNDKEYVSLDWREGENNYPIYDVIK